MAVKLLLEVRLCNSYRLKFERSFCVYSCCAQLPVRVKKMTSNLGEYCHKAVEMSRPMARAKYNYCGCEL